MKQLGESDNVPCIILKTQCLLKEIIIVSNYLVRLYLILSFNLFFSHQTLNLKWLDEATKSLQVFKILSFYLTAAIKRRRSLLRLVLVPRFFYSVL